MSFIRYKYFIINILLMFFAVESQAQKAKYVFYFIGDGMGLGAVATTQAYQAAINDSMGMQNLSFTSFPVFGMSTTFAQNRFITCSAAAGTALATGQKTSINTIGLDAKRENRLKTIAEEAKERGLKVGIISSVSIDHATPAAFYAHQPDRNRFYEISLELPKSGFDFFGGGGFYKPYGNEGTATLSSWDWAIQNGYTISTTKSEFDTLSKKAGKVLATGNILESTGALRFAIDQGNEDLSLPDFVRKAIELLDNKKGFFIMTEEGKIDWAAHSNDGATVIGNVLALDKAVKAALEFYHKHPRQTLIVVTSDHETGGLAMGWAGRKYESDFALLSQQKGSMEQFELIADSIVEHTADSLQAFANIMASVKDYFGLGDETKKMILSSREQQLFEQAFIALKTKGKNIDKETAFLLYGGDNPVAATAVRILNNKAGLSWTTYAHTGSPVPVYAIGAGQELFDGYFDNTDIPKKIYQAMGFE